jgi:hypothetical protein
VPDITREQLAKALDGFMLWVVPDEGQTTDGTFAGKVTAARGAASRLLDVIADTAEADGVVDAHICCDHAGTDPDVTLADIAGSHADTELALMAAILHGMEQLDRDARQRIRNWVDERFVATARPY